MESEAMAATTGAIFLDRDGVINENRADHVKSRDEFRFLPGVLRSIRRLTQTGLPIFVITNQAIINRQVITAETLDGIHQHMLADIRQAHGRITQVYHCPHDNHENCNCRKPQPGMLLQAAADHNIDLTRSFIVGDAWSDIQAGMAVGARGILVMTGRGQQFFHNCLAEYPVRVGAACDLEDATELILHALRGQPMDATPRLRRAFHMALRPEELIVL
jgi:D-glycero-D-manno-heptose 1,7-bisphosphate phosphatase